MKSIIAALSILFCANLLCAQSELQMHSDMTETKDQASKENKNILMVFAGSDWCRPCIQFKKEILGSAEFFNFADSNLVVLYLDFPARKKNKLSETQTAHNENLAGIYNPDGMFPKILLLDKNAEVLGDIKFVNQDPERFVSECKQILNLQ